MKTLKTYFYEEMGKNNELIGLPVITNDGEKYIINDFDHCCNPDKLPIIVLIGKRQGSNYGEYIRTNELFIDNK